MKTILDLRNNFISDTESLLKDMVGFNSLSESQVNWKPSDDVWSIAECVDHLIVTNQLYFNEFEKQFSQKQLTTDCSKTLVKHKFTGKLLIKSVDPDNLKKVKTFGVFKPSQSNYSTDLFEKFVDLQKCFINLLRAFNNLDLNKYIMSSPASKFIKENFCDVLEIIRLHDRRHINQAQRLLNHNNFPVN